MWQICGRVATYGIEVRQFTTPDIMSLHTYAGCAINNIRSGNGPVFIECQAYRWREHVGPNEDFDQGYRDESEVRQWKENDQFALLAQALNDAERASIDSWVQAQIDEAFHFAEQSAFPEAAHLYDYNYAD